MNIQLLLTPMPLERAGLDNKTVVVIDVLRSSTSICASLLAGARSVIPTAEPGEAGELWAKLGPENAVVAGERGGVKIDSFQFGNSPAEFTPQTVDDKNLILCTTNGTGIFGRLDGAARVISGALVNISRAAKAVAEWGDDVVIICSGREGEFSIEDTICGGMLIERLNNEHACNVTLNDAGSLARLLYRETESTLRDAVANGEHGRFLVSLDLAGDLDACTAVDSMPVVPVLEDGRLVRLKESREP